MKLTFKGTYSDNTNYSPGDVVIRPDGGIYYCLDDTPKKGFPPTDTRYWKQIDPMLADAISLSIDVAGKEITDSTYNGLACTTSGKVLDARQGKALDDKYSALVIRLNLRLPEDGKSLFLFSSTEESEKLFQITVDDSCVISAAEY